MNFMPQMLSCIQHHRDLLLSKGTDEQRSKNLKDIRQEVAGPSHFTQAF